MKSTRNTMKLVAMAACLSLPAFSGEYQGGDDSEFGEIEEITYRKSNLEPWKISIGADIHYYDNIRSIDLLAPTLAGVLSDEDDFVYRAGLSVEYTPLITENLFLDTSLTQDFYRFDKLNQLDFDYTAADLGLIYVMQGLRDLQLFARYRFEYLESGTFAGKLYSNHAAELGAQHVYRFAPGQSLFGEMKARLSLEASPDVTEFDEYSLNVGYQWESDPFEVMVLYRLAYTDFGGIDRSDYNHVLMVRGEYHLRDWLTLAADASFTSNVSDLDAFDYDTYGVGVGLSLQMSF